MSSPAPEEDGPVPNPASSLEGIVGRVGLDEPEGRNSFSREGVPPCITDPIIEEIQDGKPIRFK